MFEALQSGGTYIASGIIKQKQAEVERALVEAGFQVENRYEETDWVAIVARKP
ncbi:ribosomal protein L11 methyltransferase [compost metagenome]